MAANGKTSHGAETTAVAWNHKADHILAAGSGGGFTVYDLKQQRPRSVLRDENRWEHTSIGVCWGEGEGGRGGGVPRGDVGFLSIVLRSLFSTVLRSKINMSVIVHEKAAQGCPMPAGGIDP